MRTIYIIINKAQETTCYLLIGKEASDKVTISLVGRTKKKIYLKHKHLSVQQFNFKKLSTGAEKITQQ